MKETSLSQKRHRSVNLYIGIIIVGIILNLLCSVVTRLGGRQIFTGKLGTLTIAILGGYLPGVTVAVITNIISGLTEQSTIYIYYAGINAVIAAMASWFSEKKLLKSAAGIITFVVCITVFGECLELLYERFLISKSSDIFTELTVVNEFADNQSGFFHINVFSVICGCVYKLISVCTALILVRLTPPYLKNVIHNFGWRQTPLSDNELKRISSGIVTPGHSLKIAIALLITIAAVIMTLGMALISVKVYEGNTRKEHLLIARGAAALAAKHINPDKVTAYIADGRAADGYESVEQWLYSIRNNTPDIKYLYVYQIRQDGCHVVFDLDSSDTPGSSPGEIIDFDETFLPYLDKLLAGQAIEPIESNDKFGWLLTVYEPVYNADGVCVCYIGVDISMDRFRAYMQVFVIKIILLFSGFLILILAFGLYISKFCLVLPINSVAACADDFILDNDDTAVMDKNVERIRQLNIATGDETEHLYHTFTKMAETIVAHIKNIRQQAQTIAEMQNERIELMKQQQSILEQKVEERTRDLKIEKEKSESLLLNILPAPVADELTNNPGQTIAQKFPNVTVLFTDIVGFTKMSDGMSAEEVVIMLNSLITKFDERAKAENIEKIKTIGDAYMAATGLHEGTNADDAVKMIRYAQGIINDVTAFNNNNDIKVQIRLGINTGNLVAGVIGKSKFIYDLWGDTVNVASRMESTGRPMKIHVTETTFRQTKDFFDYSEDAEIEVKGKGLMKTYFL